MPVALLIIAIILVILLLALLLSCFYFYHTAISRREKTFLAEDPSLQEVNRTSADETPWIEQQSFEIIDIRSYDGLRLRGSFLRAPEPTTKTVILAHGYGGEAKKDMGGFAHLYYETLGFNVLLPDARGHGQSEGNYIGFGWHERKDYVQWIQTLIQRLGENIEIVLHGVSMGGATVLMTSGENLPPQVKCIISDCAYTSVVDILSYQAKRMYHLPPFPFVPVTSLICRLLAGYSFEEASALKQVAKAKIPILFIHGDTDTFVPTAMVYPLYEQCKSSPKELYLVPGAEHAMAYTVDPVTYTSRISQFIDHCLQPAQPIPTI